MSSIASYRKSLELVEQGQYSQAGTRIRRLRENSGGRNAELQRRLLSARVAIKVGNQAFSRSLISTKMSPDAILQADSEFVKGLACYQNNAFGQGVVHFQASQELYRIGRQYERELLSSYNAFIGQLNGNLVSTTPQEALLFLRNLERKSRKHLFHRITGLILRQKSYAYLELNRPLAALDEAEKACELLEFHGPASDYQLALLHAADCALDAEQEIKARTNFEKIIPPVDVRVQFPLAFLGARISGSRLKVEGFPVVSPHWRQRYQLVFEGQVRSSPTSSEGGPMSPIVWDRSRGKLLITTGPTTRENRLIEGSLEARLLVRLIEGRQNKDLLCEQLWPEACETSHLDNRLHRLISRLNRKLGQMIRFDGQSYYLRGKIVL